MSGAARLLTRALLGAPRLAALPRLPAAAQSEQQRGKRYRAWQLGDGLMASSLGADIVSAGTSHVLRQVRRRSAAAHLRSIVDCV